jgi:hypothetical protein
MASVLGVFLLVLNAAAETQSVYDPTGVYRGVKDTATGLMWWSVGKGDWKTAQGQCSGGRGGGWYARWVLPTPAQLQTFHDNGGVGKMMTGTAYEIRQPASQGLSYGILRSEVR